MIFRLFYSMSNEGVQLDIKSSGKHRIITISGEVNLYSVSKLRKDIMVHVENAESIVINMKSLTHMDSSGIALLANLQKKVKSAGGSFHLMQVNEDIKNVLKLAALDKFFTLIENVEDLD